MMKAELPDGRTLEFPDGTDPGVIQGKVKELLGVSDGVPTTEPPETPIPGTPGATPVMTPSPRAVSPGGLAAAPTPEPPSVPEAILGEAPQVAGGIAGGIGAASVASGVVPAMAGVALGAGFGESMKQIGQHLSGSPDAPVTSTEAAKRIGKAALTEAGFEMVGGLAAKGFGKILAPFERTVKEGVGEAMDYFKDKIQPVLLPAEATESRVLDILHNISEASIIGGNQVAKYKADRLKFFDDFADSMIDQFGTRTSPDDLGELFVAGIEAKKKVHSEAANVLYNKVSDLTSGVDVPTDSIKDFAQKVRVHSTELGGIEAKNAGDDLMASVVDLPDNLSFEAAKDLRSRLISRVDEFSVINKKAPAIGKAKKMISLLDSQIQASLKGTPDALDAWRTANRFYKEGQEKFNNTFLRRLIKLADDTGTGAENIAPAIFKPGQVSKVRKTRRALGAESQEWQKMKGFFVQHLMSKSTDVDGRIVGKRILNNLSGKPNSFGDPMLREVLSPPQLRELRMFAKVLESAQAKQAEGAGRMLVQLTQAGAVGAIASGNLELPAATIVLGPAVLSKLMLNPTTARIMTTGISTPTKSGAAAGVMSRLVAATERIHQRTTTQEK